MFGPDFEMTFFVSIIISLRKKSWVYSAYFNLNPYSANRNKRRLLFSSAEKKEGKDQKSIQSSTTPDPGYQWESDNLTIRHHKR